MNIIFRRHIQRALATVGVVAIVAGAASVARGASPLLASPSAVIEGSQTGAYFGSRVASAGDVNGDGYDDVVVGAKQYDVYGAAFVFLGGPDGITGGDSSTASAVLRGDDLHSNFAFDVSGAGDTNGDGYDDVIVACEQGAFVFLGGPAGIASGDATTASTALDNGSFETWDVAGAGDTNGDGYDDVILGGANVGYAALVFLGGPGGIPSGDASAVATSSLSTQSDDGVSPLVAGAGDTNGDGYDDVILGMPFWSAAAGGAAFVIRGGPAGVPSGDVPTVAAVLSSDYPYARFGESVAGAGDTNGDGYDDVVVGASGDESGAAFIFRGGPNGVPSALAKDAPTILNSHWNALYFGSQVAGAGDVNGDGFDDVVVNFYHSPWPVPPALVYLGAGTGTSLVAAGTLYASDETSSSSDFDPVAGAGDVNGDGYADVVVGAYSYPNETYTGRAVVYQGGVDEWKLLAYDYNGLSVRTAKIGEAYDYSALQDYYDYSALQDDPNGFGHWTHVASGPRYTFFYNSSTGAAAFATVSTSGVVTTQRAWWPGTSFGPGWTNVVWHGDNLFFYCSGNGLAAVGRIEGPAFDFHQYNTFSLAAGWTHVASVQHYLLLYKASTGAAYACQLVPAYSGPDTIAAINLRYVRAQTFSSGWTHIVDSQHGVLFYNGSNGGYRVGDFDGTGYLTTRTAPWPAWSAYPLWAYTTQRAGWTQVVASGDRLLFYDKNTGEGVTGYVRTAAESEAEQAEPLAKMQTYGWGTLSYPGEQKWSHVVPVAPW